MGAENDALKKYSHAVKDAFGQLLVDANFVVPRAVLNDTAVLIGGIEESCFRVTLEGVVTDAV
jgi:hypothetical protein